MVSKNIEAQVNSRTRKLLSPVESMRLLHSTRANCSSGIGRSVAILYAREGADVTIVYLPQEQEDANETKKLVEKEGRKCLTIPFDLTNLKDIKKIVDKHLETF